MLRHTNFHGPDVWKQACNSGVSQINLPAIEARKKKLAADRQAKLRAERKAERGYMMRGKEFLIVESKLGSVIER
jgi:hypothetical protein